MQNYAKCIKHTALTFKTQCKYTDSKQVPIHDILFVTIVTTEVKSPGFHFLKQECSFVYATVHFDLFFLKLSMVQEYLKHPRGPLSFSQNKTIKIARFKGIKIV